MIRRDGQVWEIATDSRRMSSDIAWKTFTVISSSRSDHGKDHEYYDGSYRTFIAHKVVVSDSGTIIKLNEDAAIPWESCPDTYRRIA